MSVAGDNVSRRRLFGLAGAGAAVAGVGVVAGRETSPRAEVVPVASTTVPFRGEHQAGIVTPAQDRLHFAAFDVVTSSRDELVAVLKEWTLAAERMVAGQETVDGGATDGGRYAPPEDTGEALDLAATSACRRAPTTRRWPCTPSATSPASAPAW